VGIAGRNGRVRSRAVRSDADRTGHGEVRPRFLAVVALAVAALLGVFAASASAADTHPYTGVSFGPDGAGSATSFAGVQGVAVDQADGDVYVLDAPVGLLYKFDSSGEPANFADLSGNVIENVGGAGPAENEIAVAPPGSPGGTAGDIYVATNSGAVSIYSPGGTRLGEIAAGTGEVCGVATDTAGHVLVNDYRPPEEPGGITEYVPTGNPVNDSDEGEHSAAALPGACNVAADGLGNVYAANYLGQEAVKLEGIAAPVASLMDPTATTLAVDPATNDLYADRRGAIAEYDPSGALVDVFGSEELAASYGLGIDGTSGDVYVGDGSRVRIFGPLVPIPGVSTGPATGATATSVLLTGVVEPGGAQLTECKFEYGLFHSGALEEEAPCSPAAGSLSSDSSTPVSAEVSGLQAGSTYSFRLVAGNANASVEGKVRTFTTLGPPQIGELHALDATQTSATVEGRINPSGFGTSYRFEWGPTSAYGHVLPTEFEPVVGAGERAVRVSGTISGLSPGSTYHYRIVGRSELGTVASPDEILETLNSCGLPEGRCDEVVSRREAGPVAIPGEFLSQFELHYQAKTSGPGLAYPVEQGYPDGTHGGEVLYRGLRGSAEWESTQMTPPLTGPDELGEQSTNGPVWWISNDLSCGFLQSNRLLTSDPATRLVSEYGNNNLYRFNANGSYTAVTNLAPENPEEKPEVLPPSVRAVGASQNCAKTAFLAFYKWPGVPAVGDEPLYEWEDGELRSVGKVPGPGGGEVEVEAYPGWLGGGSEYINQNVVSEDGSRVFFSAERQVGNNPAEEHTEGVFVRIDGRETRDLSLSETSIPDQGAQYQWATPDGSKVYFLANAGLTDETSSSGTDLYEYDLETEELADVSVDEEASGAEVGGFVSGAADGSRVYFVARGQLVPGYGNTYAQNVAEGTFSIYSESEGEYTYVGQVEDDRNQLPHTVLNEQTEWSSQATPDGRYMLFESGQDITGYESGRNRPEVFLYDAEKGSEGTICLSCRQDGMPSVAPVLPEALRYALLGPDVNNQLHQPHLLVEREGRPIVFFSSPDPLAPGAVVGQNNVYEWSHGQVFRLAGAEAGQQAPYPIDGHFAQPVGASDNASDVYFSTPENLSWEDGDRRISVYDARIGGGYQQPPPPSSPCEATVEGSCHAPSQQGTSTPGAVTPNISGEPNNPPKKKQPQKKKKQKKHGKKKHAKKKSKGKKHGQKGKKQSKRHSNGNRRAGK
jgi:hypothetical protein